MSTAPVKLSFQDATPEGCAILGRLFLRLGGVSDKEAEKDEPVEIGPIVPHLVKNLRKAREHAGLSQQEVAEATKVPYPSYRKYEAGNADVPARHLFAICAHFKWSADDLLELEEHT